MLFQYDEISVEVLLKSPTFWLALVSFGLVFFEVYDKLLKEGVASKSKKVVAGIVVLLLILLGGLSVSEAMSNIVIRITEEEFRKKMEDAVCEIQTAGEETISAIQNAEQEALEERKALQAARNDIARLRAETIEIQESVISSLRGGSSYPWLIYFVSKPIFSDSVNVDVNLAVMGNDPLPDLTFVRHYYFSVDTMWLSKIGPSPLVESTEFMHENFDEDAPKLKSSTYSPFRPTHSIGEGEIFTNKKALVFVAESSTLGGYFLHETIVAWDLDPDFQQYGWFTNTQRIYKSETPRGEKQLIKCFGSCS